MAQSPVEGRFLAGVRFLGPCSAREMGSRGALRPTFASTAAGGAWPTSEAGGGGGFRGLWAGFGSGRAGCCAAPRPLCLCVLSGCALAGEGCGDARGRC